MYNKRALGCIIACTSRASIMTSVGLGVFYWAPLLKLNSMLTVTDCVHSGSHKGNKLFIAQHGTHFYHTQPMSTDDLFLCFTKPDQFKLLPKYQYIAIIYEQNKDKNLHSWRLLWRFLHHSICTNLLFNAPLKLHASCANGNRTRPFQAQKELQEF